MSAATVRQVVTVKLRRHYRLNRDFPQFEPRLREKHQTHRGRRLGTPWMLMSVVICFERYSPRSSNARTPSSPGKSYVVARRTDQPRERARPYGSADRAGRYGTLQAPTVMTSMKNWSPITARVGTVKSMGIRETRKRRSAPPCPL